MPDLLTVDRIENNMAICEDANRGIHPIPLQELPEGVREGSVLYRTNQGYQLDPAEEERRRAANNALLRRLISRKKEDSAEQ